ncbi:triose-phosphate isomerase [Candidatus Shikimatogenerans silvanidophilus]|uniref:triose-phosphate isomerase n=1 Tax=Candidatus Shikimatogenerans silvanidophilus TaxID=2782547 RepID=UPI001BA4DBBB|nr:triose-phosphate isomerase [Candidatus Shikimatogenerans silvanidophilus]
MKKIIIGNWKMNKNLYETKDFLLSFLKKKINNNIKICLAIPFPFLEKSVNLCKDSLIEIIAQNMHHCDKGNFTGEVSVEMIKSIGIKTVIIGHSERRNFFYEDNNIIYKKIKKAIKNNIKIILCIGENLKERNKNKYLNKIYNQLKYINIIDKSFIKNNNFIIAYEPIWSIGTGKIANIEQIKEIFVYIKEIISSKFNDEKIIKNIPILYGGSINSKSSILLNYSLKENTDGCLIGKSSLEIEEFLKIIKLYS